MTQLVKTEVKYYPSLYALDKAGKIRVFELEISLTHFPTIISRTGLLSGKKTKKEESIMVGKQKRSLVEQAELKADSLCKEKVDEGYKSIDSLLLRANSLGLDVNPFNLQADEISPTNHLYIETLFKELSIKHNTNSNWRPLPMLAEKYKDVKKKLKYPQIAQPKLNGIRCIAQYDKDLGEVIFDSRGGIPLLVPHIKEQLESFFLINQNLVLDGELYKHGVPLQTINGEANKKKDWGGWLEYHIYDVIDPDKVQSHRLRDIRIYVEILRSQFDAKDIYALPYHNLYDEHATNGLHEEFIRNGYEGLMLREPEGMYQIGFRDKCLVKVKNFQDEEFEIVGYNMETDESSFVFVLKNNKDDQNFEARPTGTLREKEKWFRRINEIIGKKATVRFQERTVGGLPSQGHVRHQDSRCLVEMIRVEGT